MDLYPLKRFFDDLRMSRNEHADVMARRLNLSLRSLDAIERGWAPVPADFAERVDTLYHLNPTERMVLRQRINDVSQKQPLLASTVKGAAAIRSMKPKDLIRAQARGRLC